MNQVLAKKINLVVNQSSKSRELFKELIDKQGGASECKESMLGAADFDLPRLIISMYENSTSQGLEELRKEANVDPIQALVSELEELRKLFKPLLTEDQERTLGAAAEMLEYFYDLAEELKLILAVSYVKGYIQEPAER